MNVELNEVSTSTSSSPETSLLSMSKSFIPSRLPPKNLIRLSFVREDALDFPGLLHNSLYPY